MSDLRRLLEEKKGFFISFDMFTEMKKALNETFASGAIVILAIMAKRCGERTFKEIVEKAKVKEEALNKLCKIFAERNWGELSFINVNLKEGRGKGIVKNSFEARSHKSAVPCCHFLSNFMTGFLAKLLQKEIRVTEIKCAGKGDPYCEFDF